MNPGGTDLGPVYFENAIHMPSKDDSSKQYLLFLILIVVR